MAFLGKYVFLAKTFGKLKITKDLHVSEGRCAVFDFHQERLHRRSSPSFLKVIEDGYGLAKTTIPSLPIARKRQAQLTKLGYMNYIVG